MTMIIGVDVHDVRFPTATAGDGSDAINRGYYSASYVELRTDDGPTWGQDFAAGKIGIMPGGYGQVEDIATPAELANFADTPLPGATGGYSTFDGGDDFAIPAAAKNPSGAWEFISWVLQQAQQDENAVEGLVAPAVFPDIVMVVFKAEENADEGQED